MVGNNAVHDTVGWDQIEPDHIGSQNRGISSLHGTLHLLGEIRDLTANQQDLSVKSLVPGEFCHHKRFRGSTYIKVDFDCVKHRRRPHQASYSASRLFAGAQRRWEAGKTGSGGETMRWEDRGDNSAEVIWRVPRATDALERHDTRQYGVCLPFRRTLALSQTTMMRPSACAQRQFPAHQLRSVDVTPFSAEAIVVVNCYSRRRHGYYVFITVISRITVDINRLLDDRAISAPDRTLLIMIIIIIIMQGSADKYGRWLL